METLELAMRVTIAAVEGLLLVLYEANRRLKSFTGGSNERLLESLDAFILRVNGECIENQAPSNEWLSDLKQLSEDVDRHVTKCEHHAVNTSSLTLFETIRDSARAKKLREEVKHLTASMNFTAVTTTAIAATTTAVTS